MEIIFEILSQMNYEQIFFFLLCDKNDITPYVCFIE